MACLQQAAIALVGTLVVMLGLGFERSRFMALFVASALAGFSVGNAQAALQLSQNAMSLSEGDIAAEVVLLEDSEQSLGGERALAQLELSGMQPVGCLVYFDTSEPLLVGQRISVQGTCSSIDYERNPYAWQQGAVVVFSVDKWEADDSSGLLSVLRKFRKSAIAALEGPDEASALLQAVVCGYRRNIEDTALYGSFQACGLAHFVAVSGAHLVLVTGFASSLLRSARVPRRFGVVILVCVISSYYVIAGMPISALRACIMTSLGLTAFYGKRRGSSLNSVGAGIFAILASSPGACVSASFTLSALSTLGIVLFAPLFSRWLGSLFKGRVSFVTDALSLTAAASIASQLYACSLFGQLPLVAPVSNVLCAPLFPLTCVAGLFASLLGSAFPSFGAPLFVASAASVLLGEAATLLASIPYSAIPFSIDALPALLVSAAASATLWVLWTQLNGKVVLVVFFTLVTVFIVPFGIAGQSDEIVMFDIGQGDSFLVRSQGQTLLIDTGNQDARLLKELGANHVAHLDSVLLTHADDDHVGALDALDKAVEVDRVLIAEDMLDCAGDSARSLMQRVRYVANEAIGLRPGDSFQVGAFTFVVLWPYEFTDDGGNADSLCLIAKYDGDDDGVTDFTALFTGDAEIDQLDELLKRGTVGAVDILKVGHHGSRNGATSEQIAELNPRIALISCGRNNRYGHPAPETLEKLGDVGAAIYRTDQNGEVRCTLSPDRIAITCES